MLILTLSHLYLIHFVISFTDRKEITDSVLTWINAIVAEKFGQDDYKFIKFSKQISSYSFCCIFGFEIFPTLFVALLIFLKDSLLLALYIW